MLPATKVWLKCESIGKPEFTVIEHVTVRESAMRIAGWLMQVYMGHKLKITLARNESDLNDRSRSQDLISMQAELEAMLDGSAATEESDHV